MAVHSDGLVKVFLIKGDLDKPVKSPYIPKNLLNERRIMQLMAYYDLNYHYMLTKDDLLDKSKAKQANQTHKCQVAIFHPSFGLTGFQHSLMVGLKNGLIMKWNDNRDKLLM